MKEIKSSGRLCICENKSKTSKSELSGGLEYKRVVKEKNKNKNSVGISVRSLGANRNTKV